ncbi:LysE family translocator [Pseudomonas sp. TTU2014-080ASC]|uniref:LysE family translocator n=1 Tax=Pseudomonas sp. TTU2014-080ASC TaxID=1729724 RepID=UPI0007185715|nr:LysE family translocator [Pseudomonas sp. TTU2014-080ASC]KRW59629.1 lysine transporter LysE [Pseudomonas sp. TTU2014-080ASC]
MPLDTWLLYLLTCFGIAVVPGPNAMLVLTHGAMHGRQKAVGTISGGVLGFVVMLSLCATGLAVLIQTSPTLFNALKIVGGVYLIWLGANLWRAAPITFDPLSGQASGNALLFRQGLLAALSNPKALLLYTAFLPPFLDSSRNLLVQTLVIVITYAVVEFAVEYLIASAADKVRPWLARSGRLFNLICGCFFVIFGVLLPFSS